MKVRVDITMSGFADFTEDRHYMSKEDIEKAIIEKYVKNKSETVKEMEEYLKNKYEDELTDLCVNVDIDVFDS